jgi:hypothetical protein
MVDLWKVTFLDFEEVDLFDLEAPSFSVLYMSFNLSDSSVIKFGLM